MPFRRLKVRLKKEIVTLGDPGTDPRPGSAAYVTAAEWNALLDDARPRRCIDTRNGFEVAMGTFEGAIDPGIGRFSEFRDFVRRDARPRDATGRSPCSARAASAARRRAPTCSRRASRRSIHLKGGILNYLEEVPRPESRWRGGCFVFDERIALGHGLVERPGAIRTRDGWRSDE